MEERLFLLNGEAEKIKERYPSKVPIFVIKSKNSHDIPDLTKHKFLAPSDLTLGQFIFIIRKQLKLPPEKALFVFINNTLPISSAFLSELHANHKDKDGALRMIYTSENTFGLV
jgi:GABA(A) receptor-associated protein